MQHAPSLSLILLLFSIVLSSSEPTPVIKTTYGQIQGTRTTTHDFYAGIPFAAPPVGALRFKPPQPHQPWTNVRPATSFGSACVQGDGSGSEDCLYLNVYVPRSNPDLNNAAVMIWIYGGSFVSGAGASYDAHYLTLNTDTIVVTINYRLGAFGFLALPQLKNELNTTGNYGIQDQRAAFNWVRDNIHNFGGDPTKVTIFGESAGAISICAHLASKHSDGLFRAALLESGFCNIWEYEDSVAIGKSIASAAGCKEDNNILQCLRSASTHSIATASSAVGYYPPAIDGYEFTEQPFESIAKGNFNKVPVLAGTNLNEWALWVCSDPAQADMTATQYEALIKQEFADYANQILALYPASAYSKPALAYIDVKSDSTFKCPTRQLVDSLTKWKVSSYLYSFDHVPGFSTGICGVAHSFELPFLYPNIFGGYQFTPLETELSHSMKNSWVNFSNILNPNQHNWPNYLTTSQYISLDGVSYPKNTNFRTKYCDFWNNL